jgi:hypothetical protein
MTAATPHRVAYDAAARTDAATAYRDDTLPEYDDARAAARRIYLDANDQFHIRIGLTHPATSTSPPMQPSPRLSTPRGPLSTKRW